MFYDFMIELCFILFYNNMNDSDYILLFRIKEVWIHLWSTVDQATQF